MKKTAFICLIIFGISSVGWSAPAIKKFDLNKEGNALQNRGSNANRGQQQTINCLTNNSLTNQFEISLRNFRSQCFNDPTTRSMRCATAVIKDGQSFVSINYMSIADVYGIIRRIEDQENLTLCGSSSAIPANMQIRF